MFSNLLKTLNKTCNASIVTYSGRYLSSHINTTQHKIQEEEDAFKIENSLFNNSAVKYEPMRKYDVLKKQYIRKKESNNEIGKMTRKVPRLGKPLAERKAESELIKDQELGLEFLKLSLRDPRLSTLLISTRSKKKRDKDREIIIEGRRLIMEAISCGLRLKSVIFSQKEELANIRESVSQAQKKLNTKLYKVPHHDLKTWSTLSTPPGVMAIFERPTAISGNQMSTSLPITVVCDNIREPNNIGSIIRTCAALPCQQVVVMRGCCDPWESKALRGGCGGQFRVPIKEEVNWNDMPLLIPPEVADNCFVFVAENNLEKLQNKMPILEYSDVQETGSHNVVIIGGETYGVSPDAYRFMESVGQRGKCLYIPLAQGIDSLNVVSALTLILYELRKNLKSNDNLQIRDN